MHHYPNEFLANAHLAMIVNNALFAVTGARGNFTPWDVGDVPADDIDDLMRLIEKKRFYDDLASKS